MWNEYYRLALERVNGMVRPLPVDYPFHVLIEASGDDEQYPEPGTNFHDVRGPEDGAGISVGTVERA